jgi:hypothetical protein
MKKKIAIFAIFAATAFFLMPVNAAAISPNARSSSSAGMEKSDLGVQQGRRNDRQNRGHRKSYPRWYKNYGQYRRTQVGNRRFHRSMRNNRGNYHRSSRRNRNDR